MGFGDDFKDQEPGIRNKYALLIGANTTNASNAPLIGVTSDLEKFGKILGDSRHSEFEVISLLNEGFMKVRKEISRISRKAKKDDVVFFYYSGSARLDEQNSLYLLLRDSEESFLDATCLESEFILSQFRKSKCRNFIIIIDCCHSGAFFNNNRGLPKGLFALTACDENETTGENADGGYFSSIIIKGLESDYIDANRDGKITFSELFDYIIEEVKKKESRMGIPQKWEWNVTKDICLFASPKPVFISYNRMQTEFVKRLSAYLRDAEIATFVDLERLRIGDNWKDELERTIKNSRVFIFILDDKILYSEVSNWELETAYSHNIPILPVMLEEVKIPAMFEARFGHINRLFFDKANFKDCAKVLIDHIKALRVKKPSQVAVTASPNISES